MDTTAQTSRLCLISFPRAVLTVSFYLSELCISLFLFTLRFLRGNEMPYTLQSVQWKIPIISQGHLRDNFFLTQLLNHFTKSCVNEV